jgi:hypothetical protein
MAASPPEVGQRAEEINQCHQPPPQFRTPHLLDRTPSEIDLGGHQQYHLDRARRHQDEHGEGEVDELALVHRTDSVKDRPARIPILN